MHGLIISAVRRFVVVAYGKSVWNRVLIDSGVETDCFQSVLPYDAIVLEKLLASAQQELAVPRTAIMEDIGVSIVTQWRGVRRLLRFGGETFQEFLYSLEDLPDRARLAMPELAIPKMTLTANGDSTFDLTCDMPDADYGYAVLGMLRAMADDYGALVTIRSLDRGGGGAELSIMLHDAAFAPGNRFDLAPVFHG